MYMPTDRPGHGVSARLEKLQQKKKQKPKQNQRRAGGNTCTVWCAVRGHACVSPGGDSGRKHIKRGPRAGSGGRGRDTREGGSIHPVPSEFNNVSDQVSSTVSFWCDVADDVAYYCIL